MCQKRKKLGVNYLGSDFEKLAHVLQHGLWGFIAVLQVNNLPAHNGNGSFDKQAHFLNNTISRKPPRRQSQPVIIDRKTSTSKALSRRKLGPVFTNSSAAFERRMVVNVNLDQSFIIKDFDNEDIRKIWSSLQSRSSFNETIVQDGYLTTTLCSTEL